MSSVRPLRWIGRAAVLSALVALPISAQTAPKATLVTSVEGITEYSLPNGLRVLLFPDQSKPTVTVNMTFMVGSSMEGYGETGMAHLIEHMIFKGSKNHPEMTAEFTKHGARRNGSTWTDRTNYFETVPATEENLAWALDLEADRMMNALMKKTDLESEFSVVRNELENGQNSPVRVLFERVARGAYQWHGYGRSTIGSKSDVEGVPIERLVVFYKKYYQPDNAMLVVAGKFDPAKTLAMIEQKYGTIPKPVRSLEAGNLLFARYTIEPTQDGEVDVTVRRVGDTQVMMAGWHIPGGPHPDFAAVDVLTNILATGPQSRLYKAIVDTKLGASVSSGTFAFRDPTLMIAFATVRMGQSLDSAKWAMEKAIDQARTGTFSAEEVERSKTQILKDWDLAFNSSDNIGISLSEWGAMGDWRLMFIYRDRVAKVTPADIQRVASMYLKPTNRTYAFFIPTAQPDRSEIPNNPNIASIVADYKGKAVVQAGEAFDASPKNIDARNHRSTLANGMNLQMLSKLTRGALVNARITLRHGTEQTLTGKGQIPSITAAMLSRGTAALTRQQVQDSLDKLKSQVFIGGGGNNIVVNIQTTHPNLVPVLELVASELKTPRFDAEELDKLKKEQLSQIEQAKSQPTVLGQIELQRRLYPRPKGHPLYVATMDETIADVNAVTAADLKDFHSKFFGASYADMAVVGDFDEKEVAAAAARLFGSWKNPQPFSRIVRTYTKSDSNWVSIETPDKANAFFMAGQNIQISDNDPDYPALAFGNYMLGGAGMAARLMDRWRQKEGISYGGGSLLQVQSLDKYGIWGANAILAPQNADRLVRAFREEVDRALKEGFTAADVEKFRGGYLQARTQPRANDNELVGILVDRRFNGRSLTWDENFEKAVSALTPEQINTVLRKYINPSQIIMVRAGDFAKNPPVKATP